jgi:hypothetical protein
MEEKTMMRLMRLVALTAFCAHPAVAATRLVPPAEWVPHIKGFYQLDAFHHQWDVLNGQVPWALSAPDANTLRFESRGNDPAFAWDASVADPAHRTEIATYYEPIAPGTPIHVSYGLMVEPGAPNTALWAHLTQLHVNWRDDVPKGTYAGPVMSIDLGRQSDFMEVNIGVTDPTGKMVTRNVYRDLAAVERGHRYAMEWWALVEPAGRGRLVVKRDGAVIVNYTGPLGYAIEKNNYVKVGIYRQNNAKETIATRVDHLSLTTGHEVALPGGGLKVATAVAGGPKLALTRTEGPFSDGSYRATVSGKSQPGAAVTFIRDGIPNGSANAVVHPDGSFSYRLAVEPTGRHVIGATVGGKASMPITLVVRGGRVEALPGSP